MRERHPVIEAFSKLPILDFLPNGECFSARRYVLVQTGGFLVARTGPVDGDHASILTEKESGLASELKRASGFPSLDLDPSKGRVFLREENNLGAGFFGGYVSVADVGGGGEVKFYGDCLDFANPDVDLLYGLVDRHKDANPDCNAEFWFGPGGRAESADDFWSPKNRR